MRLSLGSFFSDIQFSESSLSKCFRIAASLYGMEANNDLTVSLVDATSDWAKTKSNR